MTALNPRIVDVLLEGLHENPSLASAFFTRVFRESERRKVDAKLSLPIARRLLARGWRMTDATADAAVDLASRIETKMTEMKGLPEEDQFLADRIDELPRPY